MIWYEATQNTLQILYKIIQVDTCKGYWIIKKYYHHSNYLGV